MALCTGQILSFRQALMQSKSGVDGALKTFKQRVNDQICAFKGNSGKEAWKKVNQRVCEGVVVGDDGGSVSCGETGARKPNALFSMRDDQATRDQRLSQENREKDQIRDIC